MLSRSVFDSIRVVFLVDDRVLIEVGSCYRYHCLLLLLHEWHPVVDETLPCNWIERITPTSRCDILKQARVSAAPTFLYGCSKSFPSTYCRLLTGINRCLSRISLEWCETMQHFMFSCSMQVMKYQGRPGINFRTFNFGEKTIFRPGQYGQSLTVAGLE